MKTLLSVLIFSCILIAQQGSKDNSNVELPEFVITGQELINLQQTKKSIPDLIPVLSDDFLKPAIDPDQLDLSAAENAGEINPSLRDSGIVNMGRIKTLLGIYTLPLIEASLGVPFEGGIFNAALYEENTRPYIKNADRLKLDISAGVSLFSAYDAPFLPGSEYRFYGNYALRNLKFYPGLQPNLKRVINRGNFGASLQNTYSDAISIGADVSYNPLTLKNEKFSENILTLSSFSKLNLNSFHLGYILEYNNEKFTDSANSGISMDFISVIPYAGIDFSSHLKARFGLSYSASGRSNFLAPYASVAFLLSSQLTLYGEYIPSGEFISASALLENNWYYNPRNRPGVFQKKNHDLKGIIKWEYDRFFEINTGVRYRSYKNLVYFGRLNADGSFPAAESDAYHYSVFINLLFHRGPYGYFYASGEAGDMKDRQNNLVPYFPSYISSLTYGYNFPAGINTEASLLFRSSSYTDIANTSKLGSYVNLKLNLGYNISRGLNIEASVNNLLGRKNYLWEKYRETPMDLSAGISYIW